MAETSKSGPGHESLKSENWPEWLTGGGEEHEDIKSNELRIVLASLGRRPEGMLTPEHLEKTYGVVEGLLLEGKATDEEVVPWLSRIAKRHKEQYKKSMAQKKKEAASTPVTPVSSVKDMNYYELARTIQEVEGRLTPEQIREYYIEAEEWQKPFEIGPGNIPPFWILLTKEEKDIWDARSTLAIAASKKLNADSSKELYMGEMKEVAVGVDKAALKTLFKKEGVLPVVSIYTEIMGGQRFLDFNPPKKPFQGENESEEHFKREMTEYKKKVDVPVNLQSIFLHLTEGEVRTLAEDYGEEATLKLWDEQKALREDCPTTVFSMSQVNYLAMRDSIRFWLKTQGRDLLLTEDEAKNTKDFFENKEQALEILTLRAREAEQVAWNMVYISSMLETFDSRTYRPKGARHKPSRYWTLFQWMVQHPQERMEGKVSRRENDRVLLKEEWSRFGSWATWNIKKRHWVYPNPNGPGEVVKVPHVIRDTLIRSFFHPSMKYGLNPEKEKRSLFAALERSGRKLIFDEKLPTREEVDQSIQWDGPNGIMDAPQVPWIFDEMRWANVIVNVFKNGKGQGASEISLDDLGEAMRNLRIDNKERMNILIAYYGVKTKSRKLKSQYNRTTWAGILNGLKTKHPNFFSDIVV